MKRKTVGPGNREFRKDRILQEYVHDTYKSGKKRPEPSLCPSCGSIYEKGRWTWGRRPANAHEERCPACHRMKDRYPAGFVRLSGMFLDSHRAEILNLVQNEEATAKNEHPLSRIMNIEKGKDEISITTTDIHLPRRIGEALQHAYQGTLDFTYTEESKVIRVHWHR